MHVLYITYSILPLKSSNKIAMHRESYCAGYKELDITSIIRGGFFMQLYIEEEIYSVKRILTGMPFFSNFSLSSRPVELK